MPEREGGQAGLCLSSVGQQVRLPCCCEREQRVGTGGPPMTNRKGHPSIFKGLCRSRSGGAVLHGGVLSK